MLFPWSLPPFYYSIFVSSYVMGNSFLYMACDMHEEMLWLIFCHISMMTYIIFKSYTIRSVKTAVREPRANWFAKNFYNSTYSLHIAIHSAHNLMKYLESCTHTSLKLLGSRFFVCDHVYYIDLSVQMCVWWMLCGLVLLLRTIAGFGWQNTLSIMFLIFRNWIIFLSQFCFLNDKTALSL